ncbi:hypothetical protein QN367_12175 [Cryobacterium sp. RTS3]|uniref:hypothetical protein n=1 Tax=Cryobacterium sp. RTS3 TaxID=3048643 RepID=UPI002B22C54D|nr:hypothetical protein [Cryobacterium sp. RTS3]MEA9999854.1 hypothetical protein [Cryobacterium sp. RTS3]
MTDAGGFDDHLDVVAFRSKPEASGLAVVERFYGLRAGTELIDLILTTPNSQLRVLHEQVRKATLPARISRFGFSDAIVEDRRTESDYEHWPERVVRPTGALVHPLAMLDAVPLVARPKLPLLLLLAPRLVVQDPVTRWGYELTSVGRRGHEWWPNMPYSRGDTRPQQVLASIISGLSPVANLIRSGVVIMARPDDGDMSLYDVVEDVANMPNPGRDQPRFRAQALTGLAKGTGAMPVPDGLRDYFGLPTSTDPIGWDFPHLELGVKDALSMRSNEQIFYTMHSALTAVAHTAGRSNPGESAEEFASRVQAAASELLPPIEDELKSLVSRGKLFGLIPGALGSAIRLAAGVLPESLSGSSMAASELSRRAVSGVVGTGRTADTALHYATNLRLTGRL